ncbi:MAG: VWA domain-containing protein [Planctomycetota bacterium]|nr:VWA domain-containing protein [Planctomycetota bacterium]
MNGSISFLAWPFLLLLPVALVPWIHYLRKSSIPAAVHSRGELFSVMPMSWRGRTRWILPLTRSVAIAIVIVALARPAIANQETKTFVEGAAIELVVDRSGSMLAEDFNIGGKRVDRLTAIKHVAGQFIRGGEGLAGRPNDLIGLVLFARFADSATPLTMDHDHLLTILSAMQAAQEQSEQGTAIGDAAALGVERLRDAMESANRDGHERVKSGALILMTDGENNAGDTDPLVAAQLAKTLGVHIYTVGVGTRGTAPFPVHDLRGRVLGYQQQPVTIDEELLTSMAESSGGKYFRATDTASLSRIYQAIDALEKTRVEQRVHILYRDLAVQGFSMAGRDWPPLLVLAAACLVLELLLASTQYRQID